MPNERGALIPASGRFAKMQRCLRLRKLWKNHCQQHFKRHLGIDGIRLARRHDDRFSSLAEMDMTCDRKAADAFQHQDQRVAFGFMRTDFLALIKRKQRQADRVVLGQRLTDDLPRQHSDLIG